MCYVNMETLKGMDKHLRLSQITAKHDIAYGICLMLGHVLGVPKNRCWLAIVSVKKGSEVVV